MSFKRPESALVVIYDHQCRVLLLQRKDDPDFWQSVTGAMEQDESPVQTALREVYEETGINIADKGYTVVDCRHINQYPIRRRWRHRYPPGCECNTEYVFAVAVDPGETIVLSEHFQYRWLDKAEAVERVWSSTNRDAILRFVPDPGC